jgi:hypothetical protein
MVMIITNFDPLEVVEDFDILPAPENAAQPSPDAENPAETTPATVP